MVNYPNPKTYKRVYRPVEAGELNGGCGLNVTVEVVADENRIIEMELDSSELGCVVDPEGAGIFVAVGERVLLSLCGVTCELSCDTPGCKFKEHDFSTQVDGMMEPGQEDGLAATYASAVLDMSGARAYASMCKSIRTFQGQE